MGMKARRPMEMVPGVWPVESLHLVTPKGCEIEPPTVSDGFQRPGPGAKRGGKGHLGVDVMFRRQSKGVESRPHQTKWYFCPSGVVRAIAVAPGTIGRVSMSPRQGWWVEVKHGRYMTVYRHLDQIAALETGQKVETGEYLGIVGHAPHAGKRGINHLHFEVWDTMLPGPNRRANKVVDPAPWLRRWKKQR